MSRKKSIWIFIIITIMILVLLIVVSQIQPKAHDLIEKYFSIRYDDVNSSNLLKKVDKLSEFYSEDLQNSESWLTNTDNIDNTYATMKTFGTHSELSSLVISDIEENRYQATIYVLYHTADEINTHYIYYLMNVDTVVENKRIRINNIELVEQIPVFTGGMDMNLDSVMHEIAEIQEGHRHHEQ